jgi:ribosome-associated toxin RatA of RatAB toxin-antitoxin module
MAQLTVTEEGKIGAPADRVYTYIADMRKHHHHFLPPNFSDFTVEEGGYGEGTVFRTKVTFAGGSREFHMRVAEPTPGRVITESDLHTPLVSVWTIIPDGNHCRVHLETKWDTTGGFQGFLERLFSPGMMRRLYRDELARLDRYAREQVTA